MELSSDLSAHGWDIVLPKCQGKQERGSWIRALYEQWIWWANSIKEDGISSSLISVCRGRKHRKEVKQLKERHSCLPVRLNYFLLIYLKISQRFSLETEQPFITYSSLFTSQVLLIIGRSTALVLPFLSPFLAGSTSTSLPTSRLHYLHCHSLLLSILSVLWPDVSPASGRCCTRSIFTPGRSHQRSKNARRQCEQCNGPLEHSPHVIPKPTHTYYTQTHRAKTLGFSFSFSKQQLCHGIIKTAVNKQPRLDGAEIAASHQCLSSHSKQAWAW